MLQLDTSGTCDGTELTRWIWAASREAAARAAVNGRLTAAMTASASVIPQASFLTLTTSHNIRAVSAYPGVADKHTMAWHIITPQMHHIETGSWLAKCGSTESSALTK